MSWRLKRTTQCAKCPWKKSTNPREIPNGYCETKHKRLAETIADADNVMSQLSSETLVQMACHETGDAHCIGWLMNQLGSGNNILLRMNMSSCTNAERITLVGEQHETFEDTLPES